MKGDIDTSFVTSQSDLFMSGLGAKIGANAFFIWTAIKAHADYNTGECWPGMRRLSELTQLSIGAVQKSVQTLRDSKLLRVIEEGAGRRSTRYVPRERLDVRLGSRVLCTVVIDYVPNRMRERLDRIEKALTNGTDPDAFALVDIIPGEGFTWDEKAGLLRSRIPASEVPASGMDAETAQVANALQRRVLELKAKQPAKLKDRS